MGRRLLALVTGALVFLVVSGTAALAGSAHGGPDAAAARAVRALTRAVDDGTTAVLPADFARVMGYRPVLQDDGSGHEVLARADGGCSSPLGDTAYDFSLACRRHDLGYDLLRYAARQGHPLGSWARVAVDHAFDVHLHSRCTDGACRLAADVYADAVWFNSVRQWFRVPVVETPAHWAMAGAAGLLALVLSAQVLAGSRRSVAPQPERDDRKPRHAGTAVPA